MADFLGKKIFETEQTIQELNHLTIDDLASGTYHLSVTAPEQDIRASAILVITQDNP